jgi:N-6 DNA Methylase
MLWHVKPCGRAGIVLANGSMSSSQNNEGQIRAAMVEADVVEVMVALPGQLFINTQIPATHPSATTTAWCCCLGACVRRWPGWSARESLQARLRLMVRRILRKYK